jgi:hypothetical protein
MATEPAITGAPSRAPEITAWSVSSRTADVGYTLNRVRSLVRAIRATDLTIHDADERERFGDIVNLVDLIDTVTISAIEQLDAIEIDVRNLTKGCR